MYPRSCSSNAGAYGTDVNHFYHSDPVHREEGGTPDIVGSIRAGLVFGLKEATMTTTSPS